MQAARRVAPGRAPDGRGLPPLVAPVARLDEDEVERTSRQTLLPELGDVGQRRLAGARVLVVGAGGLGAPALLYLAAAGVGTLGIVDDDVVGLTDLHRQVIHAASGVGEPKVTSAANRLRELAPAVTVQPHRMRLTAQNAADLLSRYDLVVDGADNFPTRYLVSDTCAALGLPLVWGSVLRFDAQVAVFWSSPPAPAPGVTLRDLFPSAPPAGSVPSCAQAGVLGALCGMVGAMMATEALKLLTGVGQVLLGRVAVVDALTMRVHEIPLLPASAGVRSSDPAPPPPATVRAEPGLTAEDFRGLRLSSPPTALVDVREPSEHRADGLPDSVNAPLSQLLQAARAGDDAVAGILADAGIVPRTRLVTYCSAGVRAARAARVLSGAGWRAHALSPQAVDTLRAAAAAAPTPAALAQPR